MAAHDDRLLTTLGGLVLGFFLIAAPARAEDPHSARAETRAELSDRNLVEAGKLILLDVRDVLSAPAFWEGGDWLKLGIGAGVVTGTVLALDQPIREASQRSRTTSRDDFATTFQRFGQEYSWAVLGAFAVAGWAFDDSRSRRIVTDVLAASLIANGLLGTAVKTSVGRYRPDETAATWHAQPFSGHISFPSGHATQAFALAAVIAGHYRQPWVRVTAFFVAGSVGLGRIHLNKHYASDIVAGALIGTAVGGTVVVLNERRRVALPGARVTVMPVLLPRGGGIRVAAAF
jgi:membrane-associated phospholipid phosphatase